MFTKKLFVGLAFALLLSGITACNKEMGFTQDDIAEKKTLASASGLSCQIANFPVPFILRLYDSQDGTHQLERAMVYVSHLTSFYHYGSNGLTAIQYNEKNQPVSAFTGTPHLEEGGYYVGFSYTDKGYLKGISMRDRGGDGFSCEIYSDGNGNPTLMKYYFSQIRTPYPPQYQYIMYEYDNLNRMTRRHYNHKTTRFEYGLDGNLGRIFTTVDVSQPDGHPEQVSAVIKKYDKKVNPLSTNRVWQFLFSDYSVNNATQSFDYNKNVTNHTYVYNTQNLPVQIDGITDLLMTYVCK